MCTCQVRGHTALDLWSDRAPDRQFNVHRRALYGGDVTVIGSKEYIEPPGFARFEEIAKQVAARGPDPEPDLSWRGVASCRDTTPELFFPIGTTGQAVEQIDSAKAVCLACPSQVSCLEFALSTNQDSGVWGATSEEDRRHLRRTYLSRRR